MNRLTALLCFALVGCDDGAFERQQREWENRERLAFTAWSKLYPETKLTFEEWSELKRREMLPHQVKPVGNAAAAGFVGGLVGGMISGGSR